MFLSDKLIAIGKDANPKSNISQGEAAKRMLLVINVNRCLVEEKKLMNITNFAIKALVKLGFTYYKIGLFFEDQNINN